MASITAARIYRKAVLTGQVRRAFAFQFTNGSSPKMKSYSPAADQFTSSAGYLKSKVPKGDFFPVSMAMGLIAMSVGFGVFTASHQLRRAPNVSVRKTRRESIPEVDNPEETAELADKFLKESFFRKIAHMQEFDRQEVMEDPIRGDAFARPVKMETLKSIGVDPTTSH